MARPSDPTTPVLHPGIEANDYNAWISIDRAGWEAAQLSSQTRQASKTSLGPLDGVSIAVKDNINVAGLTTTHGSGAFADTPPAANDAPVMTKLRAAGAAIVGKTHMTELACGTSGLNAHFGPALNPHDPSRHPGGSSSGSAVAVAAGHVPLALGSDTGGSIRIPAAACGVVGLKPTYGRVSNRQMGVCARPLDHLGPIASTVQFAASCLNVIQRQGWPAIEVDTNDSLPRSGHPYTVGVLGGAFIDRCEPAVQAAFGEAVELVESLGWRLVDTELGLDLDEVTERANVLSRDLLDGFGPLIGANDRAKMDPEVVEWLDLYATISDDDYADGLAYQSRVRVAAERAHRNVDVLLGPTLRAVPCPIDEAAAQPRDLRAGNVDVFDMSGQPSLTVPVGSAGNMPFGLLITARLGGDETVLRVGQTIERAATG